MRNEIKHQGKRSKLDIACDVLYAISEGVEKPTRIMYKANLTWPLTIAYLGVLLENKMITMQSLEDKRTYRITAKGSSLLSTYVNLNRAASELKLDKVDLKKVSEAIAIRTLTSKKDRLVDTVREVLEKAGYNISTNVIKGVSGVNHVFDLVASDKERTKSAYLFKRSLSEADVIGAFAMQLDCEIGVRIICDEYPPEVVVALAEGYSIRVTTPKDIFSTSPA